MPTWGNETVFDVLQRYFPGTADSTGNLIAFWTPEMRADTPAWCASPNVVGSGSQRTVWCKHTLSTTEWWNVYSRGIESEGGSYDNAIATPESLVFFRFDKDSDLDGYSDVSESRLGTNANNAASYPRAEVLAGLHSERTGNTVKSTVSLLNTGLQDAYGVEAVMVAPDDSISITNNTVGGSGKVDDQRHVIVGSKIFLQSPLPTLGQSQTMPSHRPADTTQHAR